MPSVTDPNFVVQGMWADSRISEETGSDDRDEAIHLAIKMRNSPFFEGDFVRVISRDGELEWSSDSYVGPGYKKEDVILRKWDILVRSFPTLSRAPLDAVELDEWAHKSSLGSGAAEAARFVLGVWNPNHPWKMGKFDMWRAIKVWDEYQLAAFAKWAERPFNA